MLADPHFGLCLPVQFLVEGLSFPKRRNLVNLIRKTIADFVSLVKEQLILIF